MKVSELEGAQLDYWVARLENIEIDGIRNGLVIAGRTPDRYGYAPSTNWAQGGPIIDRERIGVIPYYQRASGFLALYEPACDTLYNEIEGEHKQDGPTYLIAAMRSFVSSKFGDEVPEPTRAE